MKPAFARLVCAAAAAALLASSGGCVKFRYGRRSMYEPIDLDRFAALQPGRDDLTACLRALGAPVRVLEYKVEPDRSSGLALVWFWADSNAWGVDVSANVREASASFEFERGDSELPGCALWFDRDLILERKREGLVGDLLAGRVRPSPALD